AASFRRSAAWYSPSELMIFARRSRSASAWRAIARCMLLGISTSFTSTIETLMPHGAVDSSMKIGRASCRERVSSSGADESSRRRHTRSDRDWSSDVCSSDLSCVLQALGRLVLTLGVDDLRAPLTFRLGLAGHRTLHAARDLDVLHLDDRDLDAPRCGRLVD